MQGGDVADVGGGGGWGDDEGAEDRALRFGHCCACVELMRWLFVVLWLLWRVSSEVW